MKQLTFIFLFFWCASLAVGQSPFILMQQDSTIEFISDVTEAGNHLFFFLTRARIISFPDQAEQHVDLIITTNQGDILKKINLFDFEAHTVRVLKTTENTIYLVLAQQTDTCMSRIIVSKLDMESLELSTLSFIELCGSRLYNIRVTPGLANDFFIDEYHLNTVTDDTEKNIYYIDSAFQLSTVFEDITWTLSFSVDFSRSGYVISTTGLYDFYDREFNYRKQRFKFDRLFYPQETHIPFGSGLMLEQSVQPTSMYPDKGLIVRLVDSNLMVTNNVIILPPGFTSGTINPPFYGGLAIKNKNVIWSTAFFDLYFLLDTSIYVITRLDSNLNVVCQHFLGRDNHYRLYGIRALESGGAIAYGSRVRDGLFVNGGEDIFAIRVGENCELPTTSTLDADNPLIYISVYPNPTINSLTFDVKGFDPSTLRVEIFNTTGITVFSKKDLSYEIQVAELSAGQYFYRILRDQQVLGAGAWVKE